MLNALREDALGTMDDGLVVRLSLPWIRSLPLASLRDVALTVDGDRIDGLQARLGGRSIPLPSLVDEPGWWFVQDRVLLHAAGELTAGAHDVEVSFSLVVPYLAAGPDGPLVLPFHDARRLVADAAPDRATVSRDVA